MTVWAIIRPDGSVAEQRESAMRPRYAGGWWLVRRVHTWRAEGPGGEFFSETVDDEAMVDVGINPHFRWAHHQTVFHWQAVADGATFEATTAVHEEPPLQNGMYRCVALERFADFTLESVTMDGTISADLDKHKAQAMARIDAKAAQILLPIEPEWKEKQHEAKRQEVHFWSSGRRSNLNENFPIALAEVRRKHPTPSLMDTDRVGEVVAIYRNAMQADTARTAPVEAWRVDSKETVRAAQTVQAVAEALKNAMEGWPT